MSFGKVVDKRQRRPCGPGSGSIDCNGLVLIRGCWINPGRPHEIQSPASIAPGSAFREKGLSEVITRLLCTSNSMGRIHTLPTWWCILSGTG